MYLLVKGADSELFREKLLAAGACETIPIIMQVG